MQVTPSVRLERPLGSGGMASVWVAMHSGLDAEVAVKFLRGPHADDEKMRSRFAREAMAASRVKSAHVVKVHDAGVTEGGLPYLVMELLEGADLAKRLGAGPIPHAETIAIVRQLCKALDRAHEAGVVHRDVKPENVFLGHEGGDIFVKLLDFGIAKSEMLLRHDAVKRSTAVTELLGTPYYMSPEQMRSAKQIDYRSDLFSVGVVVYEMLTGTLPFQGETVSALAIAIDECAPAPPSTVEPSLPKAVDAWFATACARSPADRFASAGELAEELARALANAPEASAPTFVASAATARSSGREADTLLETGAPSVTAASPPSRKPGPRTWVGVAVGAVVLTAAGTFVVLHGKTNGADAAPSAQPSIEATTSATNATTTVVPSLEPAPTALATTASPPASLAPTNATSARNPVAVGPRGAPPPSATAPPPASAPTAAASAPAPPASIKRGDDIW